MAEAINYPVFSVPSEADINRISLTNGRLRTQFALLDPQSDSIFSRQSSEIQDKLVEDSIEVSSRMLEEGASVMTALEAANRVLTAANIDYTGERRG